MGITEGGVTKHAMKMMITTVKKWSTTDKIMTKAKNTIEDQQAHTRGKTF